MRITYRQLKRYLDKLSDEQLDTNCTVQVPDDEEGEFIPADFRIMGDNGILNENHPVLLLLYEDQPQASLEDVEHHIQAIEAEGGFGQQTTKPDLERRMIVAQDNKKDFKFNKDNGQWYWCNRAHTQELSSYQGPFPTFQDALVEATQPYFELDADY